MRGKYCRRRSDKLQRQSGSQAENARKAASMLEFHIIMQATLYPPHQE